MLFLKRDHICTVFERKKIIVLFLKGPYLYMILGKEKKLSTNYKLLYKFNFNQFLWILGKWLSYFFGSKCLKAKNYILLTLNYWPPDLEPINWFSIFFILSECLYERHEHKNSLEDTFMLMILILSHFDSGHEKIEDWIIYSL